MHPIVRFHLALVFAMFALGMCCGSLQGTVSDHLPNWKRYQLDQAREYASARAPIEMLSVVPVLDITVCNVGRILRGWWETVGIAPFSAGYWVSCQLQ